jgi:phosphatidate phosphatase APP1
MMRVLPRTFVLLAAVVPALSLARPAIVLSPAHAREGQVRAVGRVYKEAPTRGSSVLARNLRRLTASPWPQAPVELRYGSAVVKLQAGIDGSFEALLPASAEGEHLEARVPGGLARQPVVRLAQAARLLVISDFDDTLADVGVTSAPRLVRSALLKDADTLPVVPGMSPLLRCLVTQQSPDAALAVVSGSPVEYAERIDAFLRHHRFPHAEHRLRKLGPKTMRGYKEPAIRALLADHEGQVVLVGDSGEKDPEVYAKIRAEFPGRVARIYIRDVGRSERAERFEGMVLFQDAGQAAMDAEARGLIPAGCYARAEGAAT